ncbi:MAG TPA: beta-N-acetylglucosaminidase domain-containing protein [Rhizomicrobium sp.]|nr:beta-N-acetylglucosaminidase domain-containing protein [Rhizomicrobium sp.]
MNLGIIEGYYGKTWSWDDRNETVTFLKPHGYGFYIYAPKFDHFLRERWAEPHPKDAFEALKKLSAHCRSLGVRFGVGLSPLNIFRDFNAEERKKLADKLAALDAIGLDDLALLFDDMRGDLPDLAKNQVEISHFVKAHTKATRLIVCPSYYTDDPLLDRIFGQRPKNYLEDFGKALDPSIEVFWTGEEVCSREYTPGHLKRVSDQLRRKPFLWDNYPVNDGPRMSQFLHLRAFTGRAASIGAHLSAHAVNPALQCILSRVPSLSLVESYAKGEDYEYGAAFLNAARAVLGEELALRVQADLLSLNDVGLDRLGDRKEKLRARYAAFDHPGAREIVAWLDGAWRIGAGEMPTG